MNKEKIVNVPNAISLYRILFFPFAIWLLISGKEQLFSIFLCINLVSDVLDGFIARTFNLVTKFGARLDSLGDYGTYTLAFWGVFKFKTEDLAAHGWILYAFIFLYVLAIFIHFIRFGSFASLHLYSAKITGYLHGTLFFLWFFIAFIPPVYYFAMGFGVLSQIETLVINIMLKEKRSNVKGLYWI